VQLSDSHKIVLMSLDVGAKPFVGLGGEKNAQQELGHVGVLERVQDC
jgi:hypothetical protein